MSKQEPEPDGDEYDEEGSALFLRLPPPHTHHPNTQEAKTTPIVIDLTDEADIPMDLTGADA